MNLKLLIWNDSPDKLNQWTATARKAGFDVEDTSSHDPQEVAEKLVRTNCDMVVLDILRDTDLSPLGLSVARAIRKVDQLVPIIVITARPEHIYRQEDDVDALDLVALFEDTIMLRPESFAGLAVKGSLNQWHQCAPDFALVRAVTSSLLHRFQDPDEPKIKSLATRIRELPLSGDQNIWHSQLCEDLERHFRNTSLSEIASRFELITKAFQSADKFYMAAGWSRRHLSHNVQVFLLGLYILLELAPVRSAAIAGMKELFPGARDQDCLYKAMVVWACVGNTHDSAYLAQDLTAVSKALVDSANVFCSYLTPPQTPLEPWNWAKNHHGAITARMWWSKDDEDQLRSEQNEGKRSKPESLLRRLIAQGIARHDSKISEPNLETIDYMQPVHGQIKLGKGTWVQFLAVLADELQDWQRESPNDWKQFRLFALAGIRVSESSSGRPTLLLEFATRDHPIVIREKMGMTGGDKVAKNVEGIVDRVAGYVNAEESFELAIGISFFSRTIPDHTSEKLI